MTSGETTRARCLETALGYVTRDRSSSYGDPEDNFANIAEIWNAQGLRIDGRCLASSDVALLMAGMKLARLRFNPGHEDSWIDLAGYAACGMDVANKGMAVEAVIARHVGKGWLGDMYRCSEDGNDTTQGRIGPYPHGAHTYGTDNGGWCDGYV